MSLPSPSSTRFWSVALFALLLGGTLPAVAEEVNTEPCAICITTTDTTTTTETTTSDTTTTDTTAEECLNSDGTPCEPDVEDELSLLPHNFGFGSVQLGQESAAKPFTLLNEGTEAIAIGQIVLNGDDLNVCQALGCPTVQPEAFTILSDACSGTSLPAGESCDLEVVFKPATAGGAITHLVVPFVLADSSSHSLRGRLSGNGNDGLASHAISGTVFTSKKGKGNLTPLAGVEVRLSNGQSVLTDELGAYRFDNLPDGRYRVTPVADGYRMRPRLRNVTVRGEDENGFDFKAQTR